MEMICANVKSYVYARGKSFIFSLIMNHHRNKKERISSFLFLAYVIMLNRKRSLQATVAR